MVNWQQHNMLGVIAASSRRQVDPAIALGNTYSVSGEATTPTCIEWNNDGTELLVSDIFSGFIYQYNLSVAYDISTMSYSSSSFDVTNEDAGPYGIRWDNNGNDLIYLGGNNDKIYEYDAGTPYDISTLSFNANSSSIAEDFVPTDFAWNDDGTKIHVLGGFNNTIFEYDLSVAYDITTITYNSNNHNFNSEDTDMQAMTFNDDGTKLFMAGVQTFYEYDLGVAYDITTVSYSGKSVDVSSEDTSMSGIIFNDDGTKLIAIGFEFDNVYEYNLTVPYTFP